MKFLQLSLLLAIVLVARALPIDEKKSLEVDDDKRFVGDVAKKELTDRETIDKKFIEAEKKDSEREVVEKDFDKKDFDKKEFETKKDFDKKENFEREIGEVVTPIKEKEVILKRTIEETIKRTIEEPVVRADFDKKDIAEMEADKKRFEEAIEKKDDETAKRMYDELLTKKNWEKRGDDEKSWAKRGEVEKKFDETNKREFDVKKSFEAKREELKREFNEAIDKKDYESAKRIYQKSFERKRAMGVIKRTSGFVKRSEGGREVVVPNKRLVVEKIVKRVIEEIPISESTKPIVIKKSVKKEDIVKKDDIVKKEEITV